MTSQQNLKRREAAFLLGATAFRTREMQKCASPFVEVRLTAHYHEPTHTPSMDMRERSGSHLRERSDEGGIRSVAMIIA